jgi:hypothetical protein
VQPLLEPVGGNQTVKSKQGGGFLVCEKAYSDILPRHARDILPRRFLYNSAGESERILAVKKSLALALREPRKNREEKKKREMRPENCTEIAR